MQIFYSSPNAFGVLKDDEAIHCHKVLRKTIGDQIHIMDGIGSMFLSEITGTKKNEISFKVLEEEKAPEPKYHLHIAIAPTKNINRLEFFLEKATEIGVNEISLIKCFNSERKLVKEDRLRKVILSAAKQSKTAYLPILNELQPLNKFVKGNFNESNKVIANYQKEQLHLKQTISSNNAFTICIGPEGDFSAEELKLAKENGFETYNLSEKRLRVETAGIVACNIINLMYE